MPHLLASYFELVNTLTPGPQSLSYFVSQLLLVGSLLVPPYVLSHSALAWLVLPVIGACTLHAWIQMRGVDVISVDTLWWCLFFLVLRDPRRGFRRVLEDGKGEEAYPEDFWSRVKWVFTLLSERPLTSWKTGDASHDAKVLPPYIQQSRGKFIRSILAVLVPALAIFMPLSLQLKSHDPFFSIAGQPLNSPYLLPPTFQPHTIRVLQQLMPAWTLRLAIQGMFTYSLMITLFLPPFLLQVLLTYVTNSAQAYWSPHTWPRPHFGPVSAILDHGLRGLWGTWWHQQMRHAVSEPGRWTAAKLGLRRGGLARYSLICCSAFLLSGITHMGLVPPEPKFAKVYEAWELRFIVAGFFWMQPSGILLEVKLVEPMIGVVARRNKVMRRSLRTVWVLVFMGLSFTLLLNPFMELGYWGLWPPGLFPESVQAILRGDWNP